MTLTIKLHVQELWYIILSRLFFALKPDTETLHEISQIRKDLQPDGRWVNKSNIHLTLLFLGEVTDYQQQELIETAEQVSIPRFNLQIDITGQFKKAQVTWLGINKTPIPLFHLQKQLYEIASNAGISLDTKTYHPHITLARKSRRLKVNDFMPFQWHVNGFVLFESVQTKEGVKYIVVKEF